MSKSPCWGKTWRCQKKHDLLSPPFSRQDKGIGQSLRLQWRTLAKDIMAVRLHGSVIDATCAPLSPSSFVTFLDFAGLSSNLAYTSRRIFRLHRYWLSWFRLSNASLLKPGVEDGKIDNQQAFLDMLAWSEGTDNGRQKTIMVMTSL